MNSKILNLTLIGTSEQIENIKQLIETDALPFQISDDRSGNAECFVILEHEIGKYPEIKRHLLTKYQLNISDKCLNTIYFSSKNGLSRKLKTYSINAMSSPNPPLPTVFIYKNNPHITEQPVAGMIGKSESIKNIQRLIARIGNSKKSVLITGPTGSGKELVAKGLHQNSPFKDGPLVSVNCSALPESLMESLLFGHEKGSFTGADKQHQGYFSQANNGTLFLDEFGETPLLLQAKLLRVLETGSYSRIGSTTEQLFTGRVIAATHVDLSEAVKNKQFREDLYYRLNVLTIETSPLSERREDIPLLIEHFKQISERPINFNEDAIKLLSAMEWEGNIRELKNAVERLCLLCDSDEVSSECITRILKTGPANELDELDRVAKIILQLDIPDKRDAIINALLLRALRDTNGNKSEAARLLGVHRKVVERRFFANLNDFA